MFLHLVISVSCLIDAAFSGFDCAHFEQFKDQLSTSDFYLPEDGDSYVSASIQWSYPSTKDKIRPSMIIFPKNDDDIFSIVNFARECDYKIVIRSGGHQFGGLSSCDSNKHKCIQVDMKYYDQFNEMYSNDKLSFIEVGPGVKLGEFFSKLDKLGCFLPGGEQLGIAIGGHVLTGGDSLLSKVFGLLGDHVKSFDIILSNATKLESVGVDYNINYNSTSCYNDEICDELNLYSSVLGGSPGSFGIVTKYVFDLQADIHQDTIINSDNNNNLYNDCYPKSMGFKYIFDYSKQLMIKLLEALMNMQNDEKHYLQDDKIGSPVFVVTNDVETGKYIIKLSWIWPGPNICVSRSSVEHKNKPDDDGDYIGSNNYLSQLFLNAAKELNIEPLTKIELKLEISKLMIQFSENHGDVAILPYQLRSYYIKRNFEQDFIQILSDEIDLFISDHGDFDKSGMLLFIMLEFMSYPLNIKTSYPYRDAIVVLPTFVFYNASFGGESENSMIMKNIVSDRMDSMFDSIMNTKAFDFGKDDLRHLSLAYLYDDTDIENENEIKHYYPNETQFDMLKDTKSKYDPIDMFHTQFTIPLSPVDTKKVIDISNIDDHDDANTGRVQHTKKQDL